MGRSLDGGCSVDAARFATEKPAPHRPAAPSNLRARADGDMDEIFQAEASKQDGQASRSPDLPLTDSSAIAISHSVSRPEGSAALVAESRPNPNEQRPVAR